MEADDPLNIEQARLTRQKMSRGNKVSIARLLDDQRGLSAKLNVLKRYWQCRLGPGRLSVEEFINFGLADISVDEALKYVGHDAQNEMHASCNDASWFAVTKNKLLWEHIMMGAGLPVPQTLGVFDRKGRGGGVPVMRDEKGLAEFLNQSEHTSFFCKPITGVYSIGAFRIDSFDGVSVLINGNWKKPLAELVNYFNAISNKGYLLQVPQPSPETFTEHLGEGIATLRFFLWLEDGDAVLNRCVLKVPGSGQMADNFWRRGAQLCAVGLDSGNIVAKIRNEASGTNQDKGADDGDFPAPGFVIPEFDQAKLLLKKAAILFSGIRSQSWDVALTQNGPVLMEMNFGGDLSLVQMAHGQGILEADYCNHLRKNGYKGKLP